MSFPEFGNPPRRLTGENVTLRPWHERDAPMLTRAFAIADIAASMRPPVPVGMRGARQWINARRTMPARHRGASYAIVAAGDGEAVGSVELRARGRGGHTLEVGYWLMPAGRGHGVGREAVGLACDWAFERTHTDSIVAIIDAANDPSQRLVSALGFACRERLDSNDGWTGDWLLFERARHARADGSGG
jgi:[ribosomal protein S5]-alanine N-acetyltransferase